MAHKGQLGKVLFRRDFNLNVDNNNNGWGNRCIVHWDQFPTGPAGIWSKSTWDCGPPVQGPLDTLKWDSDQVRKFGILWYTEFAIQITSRFEYRRWIRLFTVEFGLILEITYGLVRAPAYGPTLTTDRAITVWDPDFFDAFPAGALESTFRPKLYRDGPPE
jgi:hypothetical protein